MAGKEPDTGPTAKTVASNVNRLRTGQNLNFTQLSEMLQSRANWSINAVGIRRIESGERRVTVDDLMALAVALGVTPITLLYPYPADEAESLALTGLPKGENARVVWEWMSASMWAYWAIERVGGFTTPSEFFRRAWPQWLVAWADKPGVGANGEPIGSGFDGYDSIWEQARETTRQRLTNERKKSPNGDD